MAAHLASEAALRLVKPGNENLEVTETVNKIGEAFECKVCEVTVDSFDVKLAAISASGGYGVPPTGAKQD